MANFGSERLKREFLVPALAGDAVTSIAVIIIVVCREKFKFVCYSRIIHLCVTLGLFKFVCYSRIIHVSKPGASKKLNHVKNVLKSTWYGVN